MRYAHVALNVPVNQLFSYHIPAELDADLQVGHLVRVGFGTAMQPALVVDINHTSTVSETKPIHEILDPIPLLNATQIRVSQWMSEYYLAPIGFAIWMWLPPGITGKSVRTVRLLVDDATPTNPTASQIVGFLRDHNPSKLATLEREFGGGVRKALAQLETDHIVRVMSELSLPRVRPKTVRTAILTIPSDEALLMRLSERQRDIVDYLAQFDYPQDVSDIYQNTGATSADLNRLSQRGILALGERIVYRDRLADKDFVSHQPPILTPNQQEAWEPIETALRQTSLHGRNKFLLHGVTGSGKTEIYLRAIAEVLSQDKQAIFLVPEIALTPQTINRVATRFPNQVAVVHSQLSIGERFDTWTRARSGEINVVVGTRSALFAPLSKLGLVVMDEEHDHSYQQSPPINPPYYDARLVAEHLMHQLDGVLILGSATPSLETFYRAEKGHLTYISLPNRIMGHSERIITQAQRAGVDARYTTEGQGNALSIGMPPVQVVDMREELKSGNTSMFSRALQSALADVLTRNEQAILFLNRRGQATYVFCRDCGYVEACPRCNTPMTYHRHGEMLRCHHCGYFAPPLTVCPTCASTRIKYFGAGTQQVEQELLKYFPQVKAVRWDADTATHIADHENILAQFATHEAQVMIGTQMIAKGLDLPMVTLVGVVSADSGLALPDFRANERAFQLLTQVSGRAGRGVLGGQVILQTYQPQHESIVAAAKHDYTAFYQRELPLRRDLGYPPFRRLARILIQSTHPVEAQRQAEQLAHRLQTLIREQELDDTQVIGPAPCFFSKLDNYYRWHILVRSADPTELLTQLTYQPSTYIETDAGDVL